MQPPAIDMTITAEKKTVRTYIEHDSETAHIAKKHGSLLTWKYPSTGGRAGSPPTLSSPQEYCEGIGRGPVGPRHGTGQGRQLTNRWKDY